MNKSYIEKLTRLYESNKKLELLERAYAVIFVVVTLVAGLIALVNQAVGVAFLIVPLVCLISFAMNIVVWSMIKTALDRYLREDTEDLFPGKKEISEETEKKAQEAKEAKKAKKRTDK